MGSVKKYGRQVLEAISFLQDKGYVMGKERERRREERWREEEEEELVKEEER